MSTLWETFARFQGELRDLSGAIGVLSWDQETYLPAKATASRSEQLATLQGILHERLTDARLGDALTGLLEGAELDAGQATQARVVWKDRQRAVRIPRWLVETLAREQSHALEAWREARGKNDFPRFAPHLERLLALRREMADCWLPDLTESALGRRVQGGPHPPGPERYDALLEGYEPGMRVSRLAPILERLRGWLAPMVQALCEAKPPRADFIEGPRFDPEAQWRFSFEILAAMGFDLERGRQDRSTHPFTNGFDPDDVRITTRIFEELPLSSVFSTVHEAGHGLYEQGLPRELRRSVLCAAPSMGIHESQSRLWENLVGRSLPFWEHFLPRLGAHFPALAKIPVKDFHAAVNKVSRSPIRVEADEVTYNLHILVRFELELALLRGELAVKDLPGAWNERYQKLLGYAPKNDAEGVLQDIHWAWGEIGYFPTYTLGNLYASQLFAAARKAMPDLDDRIRKGELLTLRDWLREKVHRHGRAMEAEDIVRAATGQGLDDSAFASHLREKYGALYGVKL